MDSLASQEHFFKAYCERNGMDLVRIYADEGKSGTSLRNRRELIRLLKDAEGREFSQVLIKDVSRLARNTVDFLTSIRKLKSLGIEVIFVNYDQTTSQSSEFMLTMLSAIAQEESANTSKRVKFGKKENAKNGRVPNIVYGYEKIPKEYFKLVVNEEEAKVVRRIFRMYAEEGYGSNRIAKQLNEQGILTKRGCNWTQSGVNRIIKNEIYIGNIINGKEEVADFLTGKRIAKEISSWYIKHDDDLRVVEDELFHKAQKILKKRSGSVCKSTDRNSDLYLFSKSIYCSHCEQVFRRIVRVYKNVYVRWVCTKRNGEGIHACCNNTTIEEDILLKELCEYIYQMMNISEQRRAWFKKEIMKEYCQLVEDNEETIDYRAEIAKCQNRKEKFITMYENNLISIESLKVEYNRLEQSIREFEERLSLSIDLSLEEVEFNIEKEIELQFKQMQDNPIYISNYLDNRIIRHWIDKIMVDSSGDVEVLIK